MSSTVDNKHRFPIDRIEPFLITGGLYVFTALYYTRRISLQLLSGFILIVVAGYWSYLIRRGEGKSWSDFGLTTRRAKTYVFVAIGLAVFGWFWFSLYAYFTRGFWLRLGYGGSLSVVVAIIIVSSAEEVFFRGYLQNHLSRHYSIWKRVFIAVVAMAAYKNVVHLWEGMALVLHIELLLIGILHNVLPSLWMERSGSIVGPWTLHIAWDLLVYAPMSTIPPWVI